MTESGILNKTTLEFIERISSLAQIDNNFNDKSDNDKSIEVFNNLLLSEPRSGKLNLELAKSYYEDGNMKKALEHLETTLDTWKNADATYKPAIEAGEKKTEWNQVN